MQGRAQRRWCKGRQQGTAAGGAQPGALPASELGWVTCASGPCNLARLCTKGCCGAALDARRQGGSSAPLGTARQSTGPCTALRVSGGGWSARRSSRRPRRQLQRPRETNAHATWCTLPPLPPAGVSPPVVAGPLELEAQAYGAPQARGRSGCRAHVPTRRLPKQCQRLLSCPRPCQPILEPAHIGLPIQNCTASFSPQGGGGGICLDPNRGGHDARLTGMAAQQALARGRPSPLQGPCNHQGLN